VHIVGNTTQPPKANSYKGKVTTGTCKVQSKAPAKGGRKNKSPRGDDNRGEENNPHTPLFVSDVRGDTDLQLVRGRVRELSDHSEDEDECVPPPTGRANNKRKKSLGSGDAIQTLREQLQLDQERLEHERVRDMEEMQFRRMREENRIEETKMKLELMLKVVDLELQVLRNNPR
jgi:hypothetical protein